MREAEGYHFGLRNEGLHRFRIGWTGLRCYLCSANTRLWRNTRVEVVVGRRLELLGDQLACPGSISTSLGVTQDMGVQRLRGIMGYALSPWRQRAMDQEAGGDIPRRRRAS